MGNPLIEALDITSMEHDIWERNQIIAKYQMTGQLDREDAIAKICKLRSTDKEIAKATAIQLSVSSIPFAYCSDEQLVGELQMQKNMLEAKLLAKRMEETHHTDG